MSEIQELNLNKVKLVDRNDPIALNISWRAHKNWWSKFQNPKDVKN